MLIVVCGMHRSGSTLVWQIARQLLLHRPGLRNPRGIRTSEFKRAAQDERDLLMVKVHYRSALKLSHFPDSGARYLYTYRDVRDVVASLFRKGRYPVGDARRGPDSAREIAEREIAGHAVWTAKPDVWIRRYESFCGDTAALVRELAVYLNESVTDSRVDEIVEYVDVSRQAERSAAASQHGIDEDTRVTSNHITDGREGAWRDTLTPAECQSIEVEGHAWLTAHGYLTGLSGGGGARNQAMPEAEGSGHITAPGGGRLRVPTGPYAPQVGPVSGAVWRLSRRADRRVHAWFPRHNQSALARSLRYVTRHVSRRLRPRRSGFVLSDYGVWIRERHGDVTFRKCMLGTYGSALTDLLDMQEGPFRFVDVGANIGIFSLVALQSAQCVGVDAYEPDPGTLPELRANLERCGRSDWRIHPFALSNEPGRAALARIRGHSGGSSIVKPAAADQDEVPVTCVDGAHLLELVGAESPPLIVKLDVEAAEHLALAGLLPHLGSRIGMLWVEFSRHSDRSASVALLQEHGFAEVARIGARRLYDALWMPRGMKPPQAWLRRFAV